MYVAMNRFKVIKGEEGAFEHTWLKRESTLHELNGFIEFHLLKGPEREDHKLYSSHTLWATKADFIAWTESEQFRAAHRNTGQAGTGQVKPMYLGHPEFEGFDIIQTLSNQSAAHAAE